MRPRDEASEVPAIVYKQHTITLKMQKVRPLLLRRRRVATSISENKHILIQ
jgi:hypothetical protein